MQYFKRALDLNSKQKKDWTTQFFYWLSNGFEYAQDVI